MKDIRPYDLSTHNTFRMKVSCACFIEYDTIEELKSIDFESLPKPIVHIGAGSNLLFTKDFPGTVLHSNIKTIKYVDLGIETLFMAVGSGVVFDDFVAETCRHGFWGAENLSLIPGEVGASAVQNIGAYGVEVKDIISGVTCFDIQTKEKKSFKVGELQYGYRDSFFKQEENKGRYIVTGVLFKLSREYSPRLEYKGIQAALEGKQPQSSQEVRDAIIRIRREKLPDPEEIGSAGSFFKNPVISAAEFAHIIDVARSIDGPDAMVPHFVLEGGLIKVPAAWLIDKSGFKGAEQGGAAVYHKQPLVIVNASGSASAEEILTLEHRIIDGVKELFGVCLSPEVEHI